MAFSIVRARQSLLSGSWLAREVLEVAPMPDNKETPQSESETPPELPVETEAKVKAEPEIEFKPGRIPPQEVEEIEPEPELPDEPEK